MGGKDWLEKRDNVRATISTKVRIKRIDNDMAHDLILPPRTAAHRTDEKADQKPAHAEGDSNRGSMQAGDLPLLLDEVNHTALSFLMDSIVVLNDKMDKIIDLLEAEKGENNIAVKEAVNISGTGMKLILFEHVDIGQILDISINIPGFPLGGFNAYGEVVRVQKIKAPKKPLYEAGIQFINILEKEREMLIAYAFSLERRKIRQMKK